MQESVFDYEEHTNEMRYWPPLHLMDVTFRGRGGQTHAKVMRAQGSVSMALGKPTLYLEKGNMGGGGGVTEAGK